MEPLPGKTPSESVKIKDVNTDKLKKTDLKGVDDLERRVSNDGQQSSSSGQSASAIKKTRPLKGKTPGMHWTCPPLPILTLSIPRVPKTHIQDKSQISFCKKFKYK